MLVGDSVARTAVTVAVAVPVRVTAGAAGTDGAVSVTGGLVGAAGEGLVATAVEVAGDCVTGAGEVAVGSGGAGVGKAAWTVTNAMAGAICGAPCATRFHMTG